MDSQDFLTYFAFYLCEPWDKKIDIHQNRLLSAITGMFSKKQIDPVDYLDKTLSQEDFVSAAERFYKSLNSAR